MQRYFINNEQISNNKIYITNDDVHHIKNVMRMQLNDEVICCDEDKLYLSRIITITNSIELEIIKELNINNELKTKVTIAQGLVRREKIEEVIRRLTELGCYRYIPVAMRRSIVKNNIDKIERWNKIVKEAAEQSHRNKLMKINKTMTFKYFIKLKDQFTLCLYSHVSEDNNEYKSIITNFTGGNILVLVGPEGGYDETEIKALDEAGFKRISLGKRVLRTETAPLYIMSIASYELE